MSARCGQAPQRQGSVRGLLQARVIVGLQRGGGGGAERPGPLQVYDSAKEGARDRDAPAATGAANGVLVRLMWLQSVHACWTKRLFFHLHSWLTTQLRAGGCGSSVIHAGSNIRAVTAQLIDRSSDLSVGLSGMALVARGADPSQRVRLPRLCARGHAGRGPQPAERRGHAAQPQQQHALLHRAPAAHRRRAALAGLAPCAACWTCPLTAQIFKCMTANSWHGPFRGMQP